MKKIIIPIFIGSVALLASCSGNVEELMKADMDKVTAAVDEAKATLQASVDSSCQYMVDTTATSQFNAWKESQTSGKGGKPVTKTTKTTTTTTTSAPSPNATQTKISGSKTTVTEEQTKATQSKISGQKIPVTEEQTNKTKGKISGQKPNP